MLGVLLLLPSAFLMSAVLTPQTQPNASSSTKLPMGEKELFHLPVTNPSLLPRTPLPKVQLLTLMLIQLAEPIVCKVIFPFVNQFVRSTGITGGDERKIGYFGGRRNTCQPRSYVADSSVVPIPQEQL